MEQAFSLIELVVAILCLSLLLFLLPGLNSNNILQISANEELKNLVDLLRWAQRRAILDQAQVYITVDLDTQQYRLYQLDAGQEQVLKKVNFKHIQSLGFNRSIDGMEQTFYFTPSGSPVFGCTLTLNDQWTSWKVVIAVGSGRIRVEKG